jgi:glycerol-3-phosphate dehydrogenase (NAD(P)+)
MTQIAVIGGGSWGTALAVVAARGGHTVALWSRNADVVESINDRRVNSRYLTATSIPANVIATAEMGAALDRATMVLLACPSHAARELLTTMSRLLRSS